MGGRILNTQHVRIKKTKVSSVDAFCSRNIETFYSTLKPLQFQTVLSDFIEKKKHL